MRSVSEIIEAIKSLRGLDSDTEVANLLCIEPKTLCVTKSRGSIPHRHLIDMAARENISLDWLLHGTGYPEKEFSHEKEMKEIQKSGIINTKYLSFIITELQRSYHAPSMLQESKDVLLKEVVDLGRAFILVLKTISFKNKKKRLSDFMFFFYLDWPSGNISKNSVIEQFIEVAEASLSEIGRTERVPIHIADRVASCFSLLVQYFLSFSLPDKTFKAIRTLLEPWSFLAAKPVHGMSHE